MELRRFLLALFRPSLGLQSWKKETVYAEVSSIPLPT